MFVCVQESAVCAGPPVLSDEVRSGLQLVLERLACTCPAYPLIRCVSSGDWLSERLARLPPVPVPDPDPSLPLPGGPGVGGPDLLKKLRARCGSWLARIIPR